MKEITYLLFTIILFNACAKYPKPDNPDCIGCEIFYTNHYVLTDISTKLERKDTAYNFVAYKYLNKADTVNYNIFTILVNLTGKLIAENTAYSNLNCSGDPNPYCTLPAGQKYFINKISSIELFSDTKYNKQNSYYQILFKDKTSHFTEQEYKNEELGYTPFRICFTQPPDTSKWVSFTINIKDNKGNIYTTKTDSIFITK